MAQYQMKMNKLEQSARSVFVGNIAYDCTEDEIKALFGKVGTIVHFRLVHDRDTGRPKGFGFCEFTEQHMAEAAIRHFQGYEVHGRALRVDSATASDRNVEEAQQIQMAVQAAKDQIRPKEENPYGKETERGKATTAIAKTMASLPPEKMFQLMKEMKNQFQTNREQLRSYLSENPQLAYALLQAQVVMRVVDPKVAYGMLHRETPLTQQAFHTVPGVSQPGPPLYHGHPPPPYKTAPAPPPSAQNLQPYPSRYPGHVPAPQQPINVNPSPVMNQAPPAAVQEDGNDQQKAAMLMRIMNLTDEQIALLGPEEQQMVIALRQSLNNRS